MLVQFDTHLHTEFSLDSETPVSDQMDRAMELGLNGICITDHIDYEFPIDQCPGYDEDSPFLFDWEEYKKAIKKEADRRPDLSVLIGVECGLQTLDSVIEKNQKLCQKPELDMVIGSIHLIDQIDPYYETLWNGNNAKSILRRYFELTLENLELFSNFNTLGHLDYAARYMPDKSEYKPADYYEITDEIMRFLVRKNIALEINTSPLKKGYEFINPHPDFIKRYYDLGGRLITIGSDAHVPEAMAYGFEETAETLIKIGFREYVTFHKRQPQPHHFKTIR